LPATPAHAGDAAASVQSGGAASSARSDAAAAASLRTPAPPVAAASRTAATGDDTGLAGGTANSLTVIILAQDEARHIGRCIASIRAVATRIIVIDSGSSDETCALATAAGAEIVHHPWTNYAQQFNWAIDRFGISSGWTMRLDADEVVDPALLDHIRGFISTTPADSGIAGATIDRAIHFLGRKIRWGGMYPTQVIRIWRSGAGRVENRWMDEHVVVSGKVVHLKGEIADINLNSIGWWTTKHNNYATREAIDQLTLDTQADIKGEMGAQARRKRWLKDHFYARLPLGLRPMLYFTYRYVLLLGFLDGWQGFAFHGLQGFWYRFLVDVKIAELRSLMAARGQDLATVVAEEYGHRL
jgi:glycosyltransferase involved in cell wall biosynthesis